MGQYLNLFYDPPCYPESPDSGRINDLKGIEDFKSLRELKCDYAANFDLTKLEKLELLYVYRYMNTAIDISKNAILKKLSISREPDADGYYMEIDLSMNDL